MNIRKGDNVKILYGKDSGKTGVVLAILTKLNRLVVGGLNKVTKHIKGDGKTKKSEVVSIERSMPVSKAMLVCPNCNKASRISIVRRTTGYVRVCKKCKKEFTDVKEIKPKKEKEVKEKVEKKVTKTKSSKKK